MLQQGGRCARVLFEASKPHQEAANRTRQYRGFFVPKIRRSSHHFQ